MLSLSWEESDPAKNTSNRKLSIFCIDMISKNVSWNFFENIKKSLEKNKNFKSGDFWRKIRISSIFHEFPYRFACEIWCFHSSFAQETVWYSINNVCLHFTVGEKPVRGANIIFGKTLVTPGQHNFNFFYYVFQCKSIENSWWFWGWKLKKV